MGYKKTRIVILGAGISGLSCAFFLKKQLPEIELIILEKEQRAGGCLKTINTAGYFFETGPRTFSSLRSDELLSLAQDLELTKHLTLSHDQAKVRYIWKNNRFHRLERLLMSFSTLKACFQELKVPKQDEDESIFSFAQRRFGYRIADELFDPMTLGIFAGDSRQLSVQACFPYFKQLELHYGSLLKGLIIEKWKAKKKKKPPYALFNFTKGSQMLIDALNQRLSPYIQLNTPVESLQFTEQGVSIYTAFQKIEADYVVSSLNPHQLASILPLSFSNIKQKLASIPTKGIHVVNLGFASQVLPMKGFGYLVPSSQHQPVLGTVFDSSIFPQHNHLKNETRLTMMIKEDVIDAAQAALFALKNQLRIFKWPDFIQVNRFENAIPQFPIGYTQNMASIRSLIQTELPRLMLIGNYLTSPSVNACIQVAQKASHELQEKLS